MKFLVISDTHGDIEIAEDIFKSLSGIDKILHLGDYVRDGWVLQSRLDIPVIALKGNMDGSYSNEDYKILETEFGKIYLSHGHMEAVKRGPENLLYKASSLGCKAAIYGHT
ncbi:MAG TPA: YfcE family phosphodiesterase, partial [Anaerovoracaceae bacterium]|nr:YfcE family phosphodiesterase [Anaerovoracaceae bacterium]